MLIRLKYQFNSQHSSYTASLRKNNGQEHQAIYDRLVQSTGCTSASDTLECLRAVPDANLTDTVNTTPAFLSPNGLDIAWSINIAGELFQKSLKEYVRGGCYARVPILGGQVDDEGT